MFSSSACIFQYLSRFPPGTYMLYTKFILLLILINMYIIELLVSLSKFKPSGDQGLAWLTSKNLTSSIFSVKQAKYRGVLLSYTVISLKIINKILRGLFGQLDLHSHKWSISILNCSLLQPNAQLCLLSIFELNIMINKF
jgi:hypothetical protein